MDVGKGREQDAEALLATVTTPTPNRDNANAESLRDSVASKLAPTRPSRTLAGRLAGAGARGHTHAMNSVPASLPRLLQLVSPSLPVGAYSYSQGLEWAVEAGWVDNPDSLGAWLRDQLQSSLQYWDLPLLARLYQACITDDPDSLDAWTRMLLAGRETAELRKEERDRGRALYSLLDKLDVLTPNDRRETIAACQLTGFARAAHRWEIPLEQALTGYAWSWLENSVLAGVKLVPLGQTAGQALLLDLADLLPTVVDTALALEDDELGASAPALAHASAAHESQRTRLFRS